MKIRIERDVLADAATWVVKSLPARPAVPILGGVMIEASEDGLVTISGFDYETSAQVHMDAVVITGGRALVSGRLLADITKALPGKPVDVVADGPRLAIACGASKFSLPTMPAEEYPQLPGLPALAGTVTADVFAAAVASVGVAAGKDDTLPMLTGVRLEVEGATLTFAATDRFRLAVRDLDWKPADGVGDSAVLIPARALQEAAKQLGNSGTVSLFMDATAGMIGFSGGGRQATTRLLDAEFPRFRQLIPAEHTATSVVDVHELVGAVKRVALVADRVAQIRMAFGDDGLTLSAGGDDIGSAEETVPATLDGDPLTIAFNPGYLLDSLAAMDAEHCRFTFVNPNRPTLLRPERAPREGDDGEAGEFLHLLMPVRLT